MLQSCTICCWYFSNICQILFDIETHLSGCIVCVCVCLPDVLQLALNSLYRMVKRLVAYCNEMRIGLCLVLVQTLACRWKRTGIWTSIAQKLGGKSGTDPWLIFSSIQDFQGVHLESNQPTESFCPAELSIYDWHLIVQKFDVDVMRPNPSLLRTFNHTRLEDGDASDAQYPSLVGVSKETWVTLNVLSR